MVSAKKLKRRGRPQTPEKTRPFQLRIGEKEFFELRIWAAKQGYKSTGEAVRALIRKALGGKS